MKNKIFWLIMLILILTVSCGEKNKASGKDGSKEIVLRFLWWGSESRHKATLDAIKLFEEKNPGIKIKAEYGGTDGYFQKLSTQLTGNTAPDIMQVDYIWLFNFSKNGDGFYDINLLKDEFNLANYTKEDLSYTTINGKLNAIPVGMNGRAFFFNKSLYERAGIEIPKTFDELLAADKILKQKIGPDTKSLDIVTSDSGAMFFVEYYVEQKYGKPLINTDNKVGVTKEELADAFRFYKMLADSGAVISAKDRAGAGNYPDDQNPLWINGELGGVLNWNTMIGAYGDMLKKGDTMVAGDFLTGIGDHKSAYLKVNMTLAINKNTKYPKEAAKFLNFLLSDPEAAKILGTVRGIPLNKSAYAELEKEGLTTGPVAEGLTKALT
ncbi:ABC transporter substrate-binding protein [Sebaldella termitidis]|uniref:ABC transporter substrate-binding protein n=1 Tax=Sebaldella termitidis TaxID=826 RepID=UPI003EB963A2